MNNSEIPKEIKKIAREFFNTEKIVEMIPIDSGHINNTYMVVMPESKYILQEINTHVFTSPFGMMHNIKEVTEHIRKKVIYEGKNPNRAVLNIVYTKDHQNIVIRNDRYWRCMQYIDGATTYNIIKSPKMFYEVGRAVGEFQNLLLDFNPRILDDTIKHFHDTPYRYENFKNIVKLDSMSRKESCLEEIDFIDNHSNLFSLITSKLSQKIIPSRVTHNDTKLNNVMIDDITGKALCLIDLDTVMKGSLLYDYGDALRIGASKALEDEADLSKVGIDLELIKEFTLGFLEETKEIITKEEVASLYEGYLVMTLEISMRFLGDYLVGDRYFKVDDEQHNLRRARNQIKLASCIIEAEAEIKKVIDEILIILKYDRDYLINKSDK